MVIPTKVYLAARYSRYEELCGHAEELRALGFAITSRWIEGNHQISDEGLSEEAKAEERTRFALEDWEDLMEAEVCINFTESPRGTNSRGGRHVEFGAALASGKRVIVIGYRENVFHCLPAVEFYESWAAYVETLQFSGEPENRVSEALHAPTVQAADEVPDQAEPTEPTEEPPVQAEGFQNGDRVLVRNRFDHYERTAILQSYSHESAYVVYEDTKDGEWRQAASLRPYPDEEIQA